MTKQKFLQLVVAVLVVASLTVGNGSVTAMPTGPVDETKVPHYFGPYPP